jgi:poly(hydroxyalkanoate) depolymerase family esterase
MPQLQVKSRSEWTDGAYVNAAGVRNYKVFSSDSRARKQPLFVMLHGCDQDAADFATGTRMNEVAQECGGVVLYPEQCRTVNPFRCWNWHDEDHQSSDSGEPSLIAGMTRQVVAQYHIDPARVYVAGMSAGGAMAVILGQEYPDLYAAVGVHSGVPLGVASDLSTALTAMLQGPSDAQAKPAAMRKRYRRAVPTIVFHGDRDTVIHPSNGTAVHIQARRPQRPASASQRSSIVRKPGGSDGHAFTVTSEIRDGVALTELWMVHGAGHAWTGGSADGTYTDTEGPDASREMVRFFLQHRLAADELQPSSTGVARSLTSGWTVRP